jgi:hypothetical protein
MHRYIYTLQDENIFAWGDWGQSKKTPQYIIGTGILLGAHAFVYDGAILFLSFKGIGRRALRRCFYISFAWGLFNMALCIGIK